MSVHGRSTRVLVDGTNLSAYFRSANSSSSVPTTDTTTFAATGKTFLAGFPEGRLTLDGLFEGGVGSVDETLSAALDGVSHIVMVSREAFTVGGPADLLLARETAYNNTSSVNEAVAISAEFVADGGIKSGAVLHDLTARTATGTGAAVDGGAATTNGGLAQLHVVAISGTTPSATVVVQDSADGSTGWATIATFAAKTAVGAERVTITGTIRRYTRASWTISGTSPSVTFAVAVTRY